MRRQTLVVPRARHQQLLCILVCSLSGRLVVGFTTQLAASRAKCARIESSIFLPSFYGSCRLPSNLQAELPPSQSSRTVRGNTEEDGAVNSLDDDNLHTINTTISTSSVSLPAATAIETDDTNDESTAIVPSYKQLLLFLSTTVLIWLSEPVLSLVDATVVGSLKSKSAIVQLAAIGPATTLYDSIIYMTYFLAIATTNKLTKANTGRRKNYRQLQRITSHVLGVAAILGALTTLFCYAFGSGVLHNMVVGSGGATAAASGGMAATAAATAAAASQQQLLLHHATRYTAIRASVSIASIMGMVMQAICLAVFDTKTPILAVVGASVVNVVGDLALRPWGVQGAAIATAAASVLSAVILYGAVRKKMMEWRRLEQQQADEEAAANEKVGPSANGALMNATAVSPAGLGSNSTITVPIDLSVERKPTQSTKPSVPFMSIPDRKSFIELVKLSGPIFFVILAKIACYGAMTLRATDFGVVPLATHNIMMRIYFFYGTFGDSISQTAQTYLPATLYPKLHVENFNKILRRLLTITAFASIINSQACTYLLKYGGGLLVRDAGIVSLMSQNARFVGLALLFHPFIMFLEGTVIASRDFRTLIMTYVATLGLHFSVLSFFCQSFPDIWRTFFVFQIIRAGSFSWNVWRRQRAIKKRDAALGVDTDGI